MCKNRVAAVVGVGLLLFSLRSVQAATQAVDPGQWGGNPMQWSRESDGLSCHGAPTSVAVLDSAPVCARVTVEADLRVTAVAGQSWKVAGVGVYLDPRNFWHFAVVESPDSTGRKHHCELTEMRDGSWLAQANLRVAAEADTKLDWQVGQTYRLRIALDPEGIEGSLSDPAGKVLVRRRYAFSAPAVTTGRPMLRCGGFDARYRGIRVEFSQPSPVRKRSFPAYQCDSFIPEVRGRKTGSFHLEQHEGLWWAIDPLGRGFVPLGVEHVTYHGSWCETLGYAPYGRHNDSKYASRDEWEDETLGRLRSWRFNVLTAGSSPKLFHRGLAHTRFVSVGSLLARMGDPFDITPNEGRPCSAFPNVFHPDFEAYCAYRAREVCGPYAGDPWLFGYFLDNELAWWGRGALDTGLFDATMGKAATHTAKAALRDFLHDRYDGDVAALNAAWGAQFESFDAIMHLPALDGAHREKVTEDKRAFLALIAERYFGTITRAIRAVDPDHMILGCRFAGGRASDVVWRAAGRHCEVLTLNYYGSVDIDQCVATGTMPDGRTAPLPEVLERFHELGGRPMMVTEWSFPALDSGLPCTNGAGQRFRTQAERARASDVYARTILGMPFMIGYDYFMWPDEPALGITSVFPENSNYGLVSGTGVPYEQLAAVLSRINAEAGGLRRQGPYQPPAAHAPAAAPRAPQGAEQVLWNRSSRPIAAGPVWVASALGSMQTGRGLEAFRAGRWTPVPAQWEARPSCGPSLALPGPALGPGEAAFLRGAKSPSAAVPHAKLRFEREGERFELRTGAFVLKGAVGGSSLVEEVHHRGMALGRYNGMIQQWTGRNRWISTDRLVSCRGTTGPLCAVVDLTGRYDTDPAAPQGQPFELAHRLTFFPDADWFVAELLCARNLGKEPLETRAFFFRFHSAIAGSADGDGEDPNRVPRLWGRAAGDAWIDPAAGAFWGCATDRQEGMRIRFWLNKQGGQHPDARWEKTTKIAPGATFYPAEPVYVIGVAGRGGRSAFDAAAQAALDRVKLPVER